MKKFLIPLLLLFCGCVPSQKQWGYIHVTRFQRHGGIIPNPSYAANIGGASQSSDFAVSLNDTGDNSPVIQSAINFLAGTTGNGPGGLMHICAGKVRGNTVLTIPNTGGNTGTQPTIIIQGEGAQNNGADKRLLGGTILDLRGTGIAKLLTKGSGLLVLRDLTITDESTGSVTPYVYTTLTTLHVADCAFYGSPGKTLINCLQDAIILGGTTVTFDGSENAPFSGYGTVISGCYFDSIRRGVYCRALANGAVIRDNQWGALCGAADNTASAIDIKGFASPPASNPTAGIFVSGNVIELPGYVYGIRCVNSSNCTFVGNGLWDPHTADATHPGTTAGIRFESSAWRNTVIHGLYSQVGGCVGVSDAVTPPNNSIVVDVITGTISGTSPGSISGTGLQEFKVTNTDTNARAGMLADQNGSVAFRAGTTVDANAFWQILAGGGKMAIEPYNRAIRVNGRIGSSADAGNIPFFEFMNGVTQTGKTVRGLLSDGTTETWAFDFLGGLKLTGPLSCQVTTAKSAAYTAANETFVPVDTSAGAVTITLPLASTQAGRIYVVKKITNNTNALTVQRSGSDTIDGATSQGGSSAYVSFRFFSDGTNWYSY